MNAHNYLDWLHRLQEALQIFQDFYPQTRLEAHEVTSFQKNFYHCLECTQTHSKNNFREHKASRERKDDNWKLQHKNTKSIQRVNRVESRARVKKR